MASGSLSLAEYLDDTLKTPDDVKKILKIPFLGHIPSFEIDQDQPEVNHLITMLEPRSIASEAYRGLRTAILFSKAETPPKIIQLSSPSPGEGKSTTIANLAVTFAQTGARTLLIDGDMRKPKLHKLFGVTNQHGLSNLLTSVSGAKNH